MFHVPTKRSSAFVGLMIQAEPLCRLAVLDHLWTGNIEMRRLHCDSPPIILFQAVLEEHMKLPGLHELHQELNTNRLGVKRKCNVGVCVHCARLDCKLGRMPFMSFTICDAIGNFM